MINAVSDRIRNIIKTQDTTYTHIHKSRQGSQEQNQQNTQPKICVSLPPKSPRKIQSKQETNQQNNQNLNDSQLIQKIKGKVMQALYPFLLELTKKFQILTENQNIINSSLQHIQSKIINLNDDTQEQFNKMQKTIHSNKAKDNNYSEVFNQIVRLEEEQQNLNQKIQKINNQIASGLLSPPPLKLLKQPTFGMDKKQSLQAKSPIQNFMNSAQSSILSSPTNKYINQHLNTTSTYRMFIKGSNNQVSACNPYPNSTKCKCQKLIEEILQSQNHLMAQIKYVKHFQNIVQNDKKYKKIK